MLVVHTSDWHAGRRWKNVERLPELVATLAHLADFVEREKVDLVLMTGDVFDTTAPAPDAERAVFDFLLRVGRSGAKTVLIAGNHDNPARLEAWSALAALVDVTVCARPRTRDKGGLVTLTTRSGERALVGAVPFASPGRLVSAFELATDETAARQRYDEALKALVRNLSEPFEKDRGAVHLLMLHTHLHGAAFSGSERTVHLGEEWAATPQALPPTAHYVALGHLHKPQEVSSSPAPTYYAGSPLQLDFGELGEEKSFRVIEARPGKPAKVWSVPYEGGKPLVAVASSLLDLERDRETLLSAGWLKVTVPLDYPDPDLSPKVRRLLPNALRIEARLPERSEVAPGEADVREAERTPRERYAAWLTGEGRQPDASVLTVFDALREESASPEDGA